MAGAIQMKANLQEQLSDHLQMLKYPTFKHFLVNTTRTTPWQIGHASRGKCAGHPLPVQFLISNA